MPIANADYVPPESFPGIATGAESTNAPGTTGAAGAAADDTGAGRVTYPSGAWQPGARYPASTGGTVMPDQVSDSPISPGPADDYVSTGAGDGRAGHFPRRPWQQPDGG